MALDSDAGKLPVPRGFIPQGHNKIMPIKVIHAWPHAETNCWLSIQAIGPAMALVWRASDDWAATPHLAEEICDTLDRDENLRRAYRVGEFLLSEGPPKGLIQSAERSAQVRSEKASKGGKAKAEKAWQSKLDSVTTSNPVDLDGGPRAEVGRWNWEAFTDHWIWCAYGSDDQATWNLRRAKDGTFSLSREWATKDGGSEAETLVRSGPLSQCFGVMELATKKPVSKWRPGTL